MDYWLDWTDHGAWSGPFRHIDGWLLLAGLLASGVGVGIFVLERHYRRRDGVSHSQRTPP